MPHDRPGSVCHATFFKRILPKSRGTLVTQRKPLMARASPIAPYFCGEREGRGREKGGKLVPTSVCVYR